MLKPDAWANLQSLSITDGVVQHPALKMNGIAVTCTEGVSSSPVKTYQITELTKEIPGYGLIADFEDVLLNLNLESDNVYRPNKVLYHIQVNPASTSGIQYPLLFQQS